MFRSNVQVTTPESITKGGGTPGGTNGVLFLNASAQNALSLVMPNGDVYKASVSGTGDIVFIP
jgi:hypothetical protein